MKKTPNKLKDIENNPYQTAENKDEIPAKDRAEALANEAAVDAEHGTSALKGGEEVGREINELALNPTDADTLGQQLLKDAVHADHENDPSAVPIAVSGALNAVKLHGISESMSTIQEVKTLLNSTELSNKAREGVAAQLSTLPKEHAETLSVMLGLEKASDSLVAEAINRVQQDPNKAEHDDVVTAVKESEQ